MPVMSKVMLDTHVVLDVLLAREPFADSSRQIFQLCEEGKLHGIVTASCVTDICYIIRKHSKGTDLAYRVLGKLFDIIKVCDTTGADILFAYQKKPKDFEDCVVATCALRVGCDCIITHNTEDFDTSELPPITPAEFIVARAKKQEETEEAED